MTNFSSYQLACETASMLRPQCGSYQLLHGLELKHADMQSPLHLTNRSETEKPTTRCRSKSESAAEGGNNSGREQFNKDEQWHGADE